MAFSYKYSGGEVTIMLVVKVNKKNDFGNFRKNPRFAPNVSVEIRMHQRPGLNTVPFCFSKGYPYVCLGMIPVLVADEGNNSKIPPNMSIALNLCFLCNLGSPSLEMLYS